MKATHPSARPRCIQSSENLEASCSLSLVWSGRSALKKSFSQPVMLQLRSMTARDFSPYAIVVPTLVAIHQGFT
jgi:hypothetical protein